MIGRVAVPPDTAPNAVTLPPRNPTITGLSCYFDEYLNTPFASNPVSGKALIMISKVNNVNGECEMHAEISGLAAGEHSFHFHSYSTNLSDSNSQVLGPIYSQSELNVKSLSVPAANQKAVFEARCGLSDLYSYAGRSLTIHDGPSTSDDTVAVAVCGIASPDSCFEDSTGPVGCIKTMSVSDTTDTVNAGNMLYQSAVVLLISSLCAMQLSL